MLKTIILGCIILFFHFTSFSQNGLKAVPTKEQLQWHELEFYLFIHFGPNTFTDKEWGEGTEHEEVFNPTELDCRQWCSIAKDAGAKGIIITAKHHDGFCLWPSKYSKHTVRESNWQNGNGDVLMQLKKACREYGLKMGIYLSPWDRNHPDYGTDNYNTVFVNMMKEVIQNYGPFFEFWWDGANGEGPNGKKQQYNWELFKQTINEEAPHTLVFSDVGPHIRWVGNERGIAGFTNWNLLDTAGFMPGLGAPSTDTLNAGNMYGRNWIPAECDVSIRPGWFYHAEEDSLVKTGKQLFNLYLRSVGRGSNLLLNVPPDRRGLFHSNDSIALMEFKKLRDEAFAKNVIGAETIEKKDRKKYRKILDGNTQTYFEDNTNPITLHFKKPIGINCLVLSEATKFGQQISAATVLITTEDAKEFRYEITTIGRKRILTFESIKATKITINIKGYKEKPLLSEVSGYEIPSDLIDMQSVITVNN